LEKGENKNKDGNRESDDGTSGEPKSDYSFTGRDGNVISLGLHGDEGQEEHPDEKENTSQAKGKSSLEALWLVSVEGAAASVAVSGLSFFDQFDIMERVTKVAGHFVMPVAQAWPSLTVKNVQGRVGPSLASK